MAQISGISHVMAFEYNGLLYVVGYRAGAQYLRRSSDKGRTWLPFADGSTERLIAAPSDAQRAAFVKMSTQGRPLVVGIANWPHVDVYVSDDDGESWEADEGPV